MKIVGLIFISHSEGGGNACEDISTKLFSYISLVEIIVVLVFNKPNKEVKVVKPLPGEVNALLMATVPFPSRKFCPDVHVDVL